MCVETKFATREPHKKLAQLLNAELGVTIDSDDLRCLLENHFKRVATLAHAIHDGKTARQLRWNDETAPAWSSTSDAGTYTIRISRTGNFEARKANMNVQGVYEVVGSSLSLDGAKEICQKHYEARK